MRFKDTFWSQLLAAVVLFLFLPLVVIMIPIIVITQEIECIGERRRYKKSNYYLNLGVQYRAGITDTPAYRLYESALSRGMVPEYHHILGQNIDLFLYEGCVYFLPEFDSLCLDEDDHWVVDRDGDVISMEDELENLSASLLEYQSLPKKIIVERKMIPVEDMQAVTLPEQIYLVETYESTFGEEIR